MPYAVQVTHCRVCKFEGLTEVLYLGHLALPGTFPQLGETAAVEPLILVVCGRCHLLQLGHTYPAATLFERDYGYRTGLNASMKAHVECVAQDLTERFPLRAGDTVIDIGANDGTLLRALPTDTRQIAVDPGMDRYIPFYEGHTPKYLHLGKGYFPEVLLPCLQGQARLITSLAMFYDVQDPFRFMVRIRDLLARDGIWYTEQLYVSTMIEKLDYSTICHEHACYYGLQHLQDLAVRAGLKIIDVSFNPTNGGSVGVIFARNEARYEEDPVLPLLFARESKACSWEAIQLFGPRVLNRARELHDLIERLSTTEKKTVMALGASTKGNILLQLSNLGFYVRAVGEINPAKFGCLTPGTNIPITSEQTVFSLNPDYLLILPYHFREGFIERTREYVASGGKLIFPLPELEVYP